MIGHTSSDEMAARRLPLGEFVLDLVAGELFTADGQLAGLRKQALDVLPDATADVVGVGDHPAVARDANSHRPVVAEHADADRLVARGGNEGTHGLHRYAGKAQLGARSGHIAQLADRLAREEVRDATGDLLGSLGDDLLDLSLIHISEPTRPY